MSITILGALQNSCKNLGDREFIFSKNGNGGFSGKTFNQLARDVAGISRWMLKKELAGKHIMIFSENSYEWMVLDIAAAGIIGVSAPVHAALTSDQLENAIRLADIACIFYSEACRPTIKKLFDLFDIDFYNIDKELYPFIQENADADIMDFESIPYEQFCKIVFSSGTLGTPKAVMLNQKNIYSGIEPLARRAPMNCTDRCYLIMPLNHTYGGIYNFLYSLVFGMQIYISSGIKNLGQELQIVKPTVFCVVPKLLATFYDLVQPLSDPKKSLLSAFGGEIKYLFSGGSKAPSALRQYYKDAGINLLDGYALSETGSSFSIDYSGSTNVEASGTLYENIMVKVNEPDENGCGEILAKGDMVFMGYYGNEKATKDAFTEDGFFRTGDIGRIDENRFLYLTGRKKSVFSTDRGFLVDPDSISQYLLWKGGFEHVEICPDENGKITARLLTDKPENAVMMIIEKINAELPQHMHIDSWKKISREEISGWK